MIPKALPPINSDSGFEDLPNLCAAIAWGMLLECSHIPALSHYRHSFFFLCSDQGTDSGMPDFNLSEGVAGLLPEWRCSALISEGIIETGSAQETFLPICCRSLGFCHVFDNLEKDADHSLPCWDWIYPRLLNSSVLLGTPKLLKVFVRTCLMPNGRYSSSMCLFSDCKLDRIYEKRWYAVCTFIDSSRRHFLVMRAVLE